MNGIKLNNNRRKNRKLKMIKESSNKKKNNQLAKSRNPNRVYKAYIYKLCRSVSSGNRNAEEQLREELEINTLAKWAVKHWLKTHKKNDKDFLPSAMRVSRFKKLSYGNAFKPYKGGLPSLGKRR